MAPATDDVIAQLDALRQEVERCSRCPLGATRTRAVFGEGDPGADLMFVGEAPGYHEDQQGRPFVGQAGKLLERLLASIGMTREQVFIANVLKSRPPNNRDPRPEEIEACRPYLYRQIELIKPKVICTLGNFATKLLSGDQTGITKVHGQPRPTVISGHPLYLYPIFHPAAALYTPAMLTTLEEDFSRLPQLLAHAAPAPGEEAAAPPAAERPAWRPPDHLHRDVAPAARAADAPAPADPAPPAGGAMTFDEAPPAPERPGDPVTADPQGPDAAAPAASAGTGAVAGPSAAAPDPAPAAPAPAAPDAAAPDPPPSARPAPAGPSSPPSADPVPAASAEPEQLGLF